MDGINAKHLSTSFGRSPNTITLTLTSPKVPPKVTTPTSALVDVDLFDDHDNIMIEITVNLRTRKMKTQRLFDTLMIIKIIP
jgi:hypothetical protein